MGELLRLVIVLAIIYWVYTYVKRFFGSPPPLRPAPPPVAAIEDLRRCPTCGTYVSPDAGGCGRPECPASAGKRH